MFHYISNFTEKQNLSLLFYSVVRTSKVESDREKAEMFNNYIYSVFVSSDFVLPKMEELAKPTNLISDISLRFKEVYQLLSTSTAD